MRGHEDVRHARRAVAERFARDDAPSIVASTSVDDAFGLAHEHRVGEGRERQRVGEGERPAREDERMRGRRALAKRRDARQLEQLDQPASSSS